MADISERMISKGDLQDLLQETSLVGSGTVQYYFETSNNEDEAMRTLRENIASKIWSHEWTMFAYGPGVSTDPLEAQFLKVHLTMKQSCMTLEIGMITRYGADVMRMDSGYATLVSIEIDPFRKPWVQECLTSMPNILSRHKIEVGPTQDTLVKMPSSDAFDLMYIDVNKSDDQHYVKVLIASGLPSVETDQSIRLSYVWSLEFVVWIAGTISTEMEPSDRALVSKHDQEPRARFDARFSLAPVYKRHEQQHGCEATLPSLLDSMVSMTRSNTCQNKVLTRIVIFSCSSQSRPSILYTSLLKRWRKPEQQSHEHFVDIADNTEMSDDVLEENNSKIYVKTINKKTISICYYDSMKAAVILEEVERRTAIPRDMTRLTHKGKDINEKKSMKDNNIDTNETIEMSMRLLGGMEVNEQMDTHETEEDREKKRKLDEGKEGKATKPSEDIAHLRKDIMEALKKTDEKMECYSRKNEEKMIDFSKKADDLMERFMFMTNSVGTQIQGMNSSIVKLHETNEKMKEEGENKFNKIDERFKDMEKRMMDLDMKYKNRSDDERNGSVIANQGETVIAGLHKETTESEVADTLKEMIKEIGMDYEKVKLVCPAKPITHAFVYFENDNESNKFIRSANMLKKELKGRKIRITRSMEAEERFYNKRIGYVKNCINKKHGVPLHSISLNWNTKHVSIKGQIVAKTCQDGSLKFSKFQDVEDEVDELMQKWQTKNSS